MTGPVLVALDLDRTMIYSGPAVSLDGARIDPAELAVAELRDGEPVSFFTRRARTTLAELSLSAAVVPATTRSQEQYRRVRWPGPPPQYAVVTNGGGLLVDGNLCADWTAQVEVALADSATTAEVAMRLCRLVTHDWVLRLRIVENLFCYLVLDRDRLPPATFTELRDWCAERGWNVSLQGRKLYVVPARMTKAAAVAEIARRMGAERVLAAGDSLLDAELLAAADQAIRPAHGELHAAGWQVPGLWVTESSGILAGEEIVTRLLAAVRSAAATS
jgi:hypothetical protein